MTAKIENAVHLNGSVPLENAEAVFRAASAALGERLARIPDGETGERTNWIVWQAQVFQASGDFTAEEDTTRYDGTPKFRLRDPGGPVRFGPLGYAAAALASYETFARLKQEGVVGARVRFQVSLPTPVAVVAGFVAESDRAASEKPYAEALDAELQQILDAIPAEELSLQWDVAVEFGMLENAVFAPWWDEPLAGILDRLVALGDRIPEEVGLGYHLCYGDAGHQHFVQPQDTSLLVEVAQGLSDRLVRRLDYVHMPVPRDRGDAAYFAPLAGLSLPPETRLFLGLVHMTDGEDGAAARLAAARESAPAFGVATECGFGRRSPESVGELLELHAAVLDASA